MAQESIFQTIDETDWDTKYADRFGKLPYGVAMKQGPREEMEDFTHIIPRARCGFFFAGARLCCPHQSHWFSLLSRALQHMTTKALACSGVRWARRGERGEVPVQAAVRSTVRRY